MPKPPGTAFPGRAPIEGGARPDDGLSEIGENEKLTG